VEHYPLLATDAGDPAGVEARRLMMSLWEDAQNPLRAAQARLDLWEETALGRWPLEPARSRDLLRSLRDGPPPASALPESPAKRAAEITRLSAALDRQRTRVGKQWAARRAELEGRLRGLPDGAAGFWWRSPDPDVGWAVVPLRDGWAAAEMEIGAFFQKTRAAADALARGGGARLRDADVPLEKARWTSRREIAVPGTVPPLRFTLDEALSPEEKTLFRRRRRAAFAIVGLGLALTALALGMLQSAARRRMEAADMKSDFVANVSHEIRTPLSAIAYIGERLKAGRTRSPEEARDLITMLGEETARLAGLVDNILDFSKAAEGKRAYALKPGDLRAVVVGAEKAFRARALAHNVPILVSLPPDPVPAAFDPDAAVRAVVNLLDNGMKYSPRPAPLTLALTVEKDRGLIVVTDQGIGIPREEWGKIFDKFHRVEKPLDRGRRPGVGLGLALVKHIMEGHGGGVTVASDVGKGSAFSLWFPLT
jgi:two-component system phosphate regulon sensor histidine kinase PhoR